MGNIVEKIQEFGIEFLGRYYSFYNGIVEDNDDLLKTGKLQVYVPSILGGIHIIAAQKSTFGSLGSGVKFLSPIIGDIVRIEFENGNLSMPVWSPSNWTQNEVPEELKPLDSVGFVTPNGNKVYLQDNDGILTIQVTGEAEIKVEDGKSIRVSKEKVEINGGENGGIVNISAIRSLITALQKDLLIAKSGANLAQWMAENMSKLEDTNTTH